MAGRFPSFPSFNFPRAASGCRECPKGKADVGAPRAAADFPDEINAECVLGAGHDKRGIPSERDSGQKLVLSARLHIKLSERALVCRAEFRGLGAWTSLPGYLREATDGSTQIQAIIELRGLGGFSAKLLPRSAPGMYTKKRSL